MGLTEKEKTVADTSPHADRHPLDDILPSGSKVLQQAIEDQQAVKDMLALLAAQRQERLAASERTLFQEIYRLQRGLANSEAYHRDAATRMFADTLHQILVFHLDEEQPGHRYEPPVGGAIQDHRRYEEYLVWLKAGRPDDWKDIR